MASLRKCLIEQTLYSGADGHERRVADRLSIIAAASGIVTSVSVAGWHNVVGGGSSEVAEDKHRIAETLKIHCASRFQRWPKNCSDRVVITNRIGFVKVEGDPDIAETESTYFL